ncbi:HamA C-terminal domain-containing protein [Cohnella massiliensis]|uniref:HamA C-terminal domain-containing protein n=1 Tax=Cohnella massiliensis TaxID=1816691 RepID=UPI0009BAD436|nr:DUF1837 domain-containing protein [Cohnella massiliensis]
MNLQNNPIQRQAHLKPIDLDSLLSNTEAFLNTMYYVKTDQFALVPRKEHIATCINYSDLIEMRDEFVNELVSTIIQYVYSTEKQNKLLQQFTAQGRDISAAYMKIRKLAQSKFRQTDLKGQFSELLLYNLLQYHFKAVPILRKMPITTNPNLERNGADALHIALENGKYVIYLGEAKTYDRKSYGLNQALRDSLSSIVEHYNAHRKELNLYIYEDFLPKELESIAEAYLQGSLNLEVRLICMVTYDNKNSLTGSNREELIESTIQSIQKDIKSINIQSYDALPKYLYPRISYIIFPVNKLNDLLTDFKKELGV